MREHCDVLDGLLIYLDVIPPKLKPTFQKILDEIKAKKEDLERS
jgi:hypothetical protein